MFSTLEVAVSTEIQTTLLKVETKKSFRLSPMRYVATYLSKPGYSVLSQLASGT
jgi:hypothetical protein